MEKILKTLESLKVPTLSSLDGNFGGSINTAVVAAADTTKTKKKERISHCLSVTDAMCSSSIQTLGDYTKILEHAAEVLFQLCNDPDPEIRLVATDCLHRVVRTVKDQYQHRFQMEIYKEIKKNQNPRSLRVALSLFAFMSPMIRPQKCRVFMLSLLPCFSQISKRTEESLFEHMVPAFGEILKNLGPFINDNEVKMLCKDFIANLGSSSAIIRRSSACILVHICQYSRKPHVFLPKLLAQVVELIVPNLMEKSVALIIGALLCIRECIQPLYQQLRENFERKSPDQENVVKNLIQVYEMCMILCNHDDHNVITTSLETLVQLFNAPVQQVVQRLVSTSGIQNSIDGDAWESKGPESQISSSMCSLAYSDTAKLLEGDSDLPNFRSMISSAASEVREDFEVDMSAESSRRNSEVFVMESTRGESPFPTEPLGSSAEVLSHSDEERQVLGKSYGLGVLHFPEIQIGSLYEENVPLYYCARFLAYNFLLAGLKAHERPDSEIRISVKVLAINCLRNIVTFCPEVLLLPLAAGDSAVIEPVGQSIEDVLLYLKHSDPLLRGTTYMLIGSFVQSMLRCSSNEFCEQQIMKYLPHLNQGLRDTSNIGVKCAIAGVGCCLTTVLRKKIGRSAVVEIIEALLSASYNSYWLVKVDLVELLSQVEWNMVPNGKWKKKQVLHLFLEFLTDEDIRVRTATASALLRYITKSADVGTSMSSLLCEGCVLQIIDDKAKHRCFCSVQELTVLQQLEAVLNQLTTRLEGGDDKFAMAGYYHALALLSEKFPPKQLSLVWRCGSSGQVPSLLVICIDSLRSSPIVYDSAIHRSLLSLGTNLFLGCACAEFVEEDGTVGGGIFLLPESNLTTIGVQLLQHCVAIIKLYQSLLESSSAHSQSRKLSTSPVLSPVKKFSQKLENEKKVLENESGKKSKGASVSSTVCPTHFRKIGDVLSQNWKVYKSNLDFSVTTKFTSLLVAALNSLGLIFEHIQPNYAGLAGLIDEILGATSSVFHLCPIPTIKCIQKMLKCIFSGVGENGESTTNVAAVEDPIDGFRLFAEGFHRRLYTYRRSAVTKKPQEKSILSGYIRQFEPVVVNALRMYTTSSDASIQAEVLRLLSLLIKGHVNYGLVDKSQVFLGFVIKQIGFLEEGHIRNNGEMVEEMFEFLTLLSHEHQHANRFIDIPKILRLCDGLVASGQNPLTHCIPALKKCVVDLFIQRSPSALTNLEKKELEAQREVIFQMLMKLSSIPEALPILWVVMESRRALSEVKWNEDSMVLTAHLLPLIENGELQAHNRQHFCGLIALLLSVSGASLLRVGSIAATIKDSINLSKHTNATDFHQWQLSITVQWLLLVRLYCSKEGTVTEQDCTAKFLLELLTSYVGTMSSVLKSAHLDSNQELATELLITFLQSVCTFLRQGGELGIVDQLKSDEYVDSWKDFMKAVEKLQVLEPTLKNDVAQIMYILLPPDITVWSSLLNSCENSADPILLQLLQALSRRQEPVPAIEEWLSTTHGEAVVNNAGDPDVLSLLKRMNGERLRTILMAFLNGRAAEFEVAKVKRLLILLEHLHDKHLEICSRISMSLLERTEEPYLLLEISHFASFVYTKLRAGESHLSEDHKAILIKFAENVEAASKFPRLASVIRGLISSGTKAPKPLVKPGSPVLTWCVGEIGCADGLAIAKVLSTMSYSQIIHIFSQREFNFAVLRYCFLHLRKMFEKDLITSEEIVDLFTTEKRSCLIGRLSLGVATFDYFVEILDSWENTLETHTSCPDMFDPLGVPFASNVRHMWAATVELLILKNTVIEAGVPHASFGNNFISTKIFTFSFEFAGALSLKGMKHLPDFLSFAASVISDLNFLKFFNVKEDPEPLFVSIGSLGRLLRLIVPRHNLSVSFADSSSESWWTELHPDFAHILAEMNHLVTFISQVDSGKLSIDPSISKPLRKLTVGLGRCDILSSWLLICHLGWKPPCIVSDETIIPAIENIPMDILQNEKDLLLQYISKFNFLGAGNKIQFEENWMIFLSVISSYGDEHSQLQVVCAGVRALSMVLKTTVSVRYSLKSESLGESFSAITKALANVDASLAAVRPELCKRHRLLTPTLKTKKVIVNMCEVDVNSCIRFLTDLFSQWLQNPQGKMPLLLLSEVVQCVVVIAEYFEDMSEFCWMFETLMEVFKSFEKEDEILWPHLIYGIFFAASKIHLEPDVEASLVQILDGALSSSCINVSVAAIDSANVYLQNRPDCLPVLNVVCAFVLKYTQLEETLCDTETRSCLIWRLLLFIWLYGPSSGTCVTSFEQETLSNILTALSPLNKVYVSVRLLVLHGLREKVLQKSLDGDAKKKITKVAVDSLKSKNIAIFFEAIRLVTVIFYTGMLSSEFEEFCSTYNPEPEVLMQMAERSEIFFQLLKGSVRYKSLIAAKILPHIMMDFLPPSEILNRVIAEFMSPLQNSPELLAPVVAQLFEKARRKPKEAALVREWILSGVPNFLANANVSRVCWSLSLFFIGVSTNPDVARLLPCAELRRQSLFERGLFVHSSTDFYLTLTHTEKESFMQQFVKGPFQTDESSPYLFLLEAIAEYESITTPGGTCSKPDA